jgi:osmoprotectant transport system substrate-binding protein
MQLRGMRWPVLLLVSLGAALGPACGSGEGDGDGPSPSAGAKAGAAKGRIVVGSKLDTEAQLLGHLMAAVLEDRGYEVETKIPLGNTDLVRKALESGRIDIYWEFTSSGLSLLDQEPVGDPQAAYEKVKALDDKNGITWLPAAAMNDTYALAVKGEGGPIGAKTLSELAGHLKKEPGTRLCVDPEGGFRADVLPRLEERYGITFSEPRQLGYELIPPAVAGGDCDVGIVYSTAALIVKSGLRVLDDDRRAFGAYTPAPTVRTDRLERWPGLAADLAELTAVLDTPTITRLNARVDVDGVPVRQVAEDFLGERGLVEGGG